MPAAESCRASSGLVKLHKTPVAAHTMHDQWFSRFFGNRGLTHEYSFLTLCRSAAQCIETGLPDSDNTSVGHHGLKTREKFLRHFVSGAPGMYAYRIPGGARHAVHRLVGLYRAYHTRTSAAVGVDIVETMQVGDHGTGS